MQWLLSLDTMYLNNYFSENSLHLNPYSSVNSYPILVPFKVFCSKFSSQRFMRYDFANFASNCRNKPLKLDRVSENRVFWHLSTLKAICGNLGQNFKNPSAWIVSRRILSKVLLTEPKLGENWRRSRVLSDAMFLTPYKDVFS